MGLINDVQTIVKLIKPVKGDSHRERIENFYKNQAEKYDEFREKLLPGRRHLMSQLRLEDNGDWLDVGAGTGHNLEYMGLESVKKFKEIYLLDISTSLLARAKQRVESLNLNNVSLIENDICDFKINKKFDLITFSYSLTMIPHWFQALEFAFDHLKPGGKIGVVDFYISKKFVPVGRVKHSKVVRTFWPIWFSWDNVFISPDHLPFLQSKFKTLKLHEGMHKIPYLPLGKVPYYLFIGEKSIT